MEPKFEGPYRGEQPAVHDFDQQPECDISVEWVTSSNDFSLGSLRE